MAYASSGLRKDALSSIESPLSRSDSNIRPPCQAHNGTDFCLLAYFSGFVASLHKEASQ